MSDPHVADGGLELRSGECAEGRTAEADEGGGRAAMRRETGSSLRVCRRLKEARELHRGWDPDW